MRSLIIAGAMLVLTLANAASAQEAVDTESAVQQQQAETHVEQLQEPLYNPFVERYVLDELKQLRSDMANQRVEILQQIVDRHVESVDKGVTYATNTITYFFYLIAGVSSILVVVGWTSIREIKERMGTLADEEVRKLVEIYEGRLQGIEKQLTQKKRCTLSPTAKKLNVPRKSIRSGYVLPRKRRRPIKLPFTITF